MNARKIINTVALVCMITAIIAGVIESGFEGEFFSGLLLGICFTFTLVIRWWDL